MLIIINEINHHCIAMVIMVVRATRIMLHAVPKAAPLSRTGSALKYNLTHSNRQHECTCTTLKHITTTYVTHNTHVHYKGT